MFRVEIKRIPRNEAGENLIEPHEYESKWSHYKSLLFLGTFSRCLFHLRFFFVQINAKAMRLPTRSTALHQMILL